jgi:hypothetical protein
MTSVATDFPKDTMFKGAVWFHSICLGLEKIYTDENFTKNIKSDK